MIKKTVETACHNIELDGKNIPIHFVKDQYEDEPISSNIRDALNDFYNIMHLIWNSWPRKKGYRLVMCDAGYTILHKNSKAAWIGIPEKSDRLMVMLYAYSEMWNKAKKGFKGPMGVYDFDEDIWVYSELKLSDISKEASKENQRKVLESWISKIVEKIF